LQKNITVFYFNLLWQLKINVLCNYINKNVLFLGSLGQRPKKVLYYTFFRTQAFLSYFYLIAKELHCFLF